MKQKVFAVLAVILFVSVICNIRNISAHAEAIPAVIEQNYSKMEKIDDHGSRFVVDYISESWDYETVEKILNDVKALSDDICSGYSDDYDKIRAMAFYVSDNLAYDFDASHNAVTFDVISLENVFEKKRTTCAGFANLFSSLCNAQGFYCVNIRGSAVSGEDGVYVDNLDDENTVMNHEWTAVWYDGRWMFVDCTWNCMNTYSNGNFYYGNGSLSKYFDISVEDISVDHKAILVDHREFFDALSALEPPAPETELQTEESAAEHENTAAYSETEKIVSSEAESETESSESEAVLSESSTSSVTSLSESESTAVSDISSSEISESTSPEITSEADRTESDSKKGAKSMSLVFILITAAVIAIAAVLIGAAVKK